MQALGENWSTSDELGEIGAGWHFICMQIFRGKMRDDLFCKGLNIYG